MTAFDLQLEGLLGAYQATLSEKLKVLREAVRAAHASRDDLALRDEARGQAHKLRGTAGCFDAEDVGELVGRVEDLLVGLPEGPTTADDPAAWAAMESALDEAASAATSPRPARESRPMPERLETQRPKLLVVDEDAGFVRHMCVLGAEQLLDVVGVVPPSAAVEAARHTRFDAAMIDVMLAPADACFHLALALRGLPGCEALPIAFVSTSGEMRDRVAVARVARSLFVEKPLDAHRFGLAMHRLSALRDDPAARVLIADDDDRFAARTAALLRREGVLVATLNDCTRILDALDETRPDLLLLDVAMPSVGGLDVCRVLRTTQRWEHLPVLFLSGRADVASRLLGLAAGGDDFLAKDISDDELVARVRVGLARSRRFAQASGSDALTGQWLRARFVEEIATPLALARRHGTPLAVAMIDVDHFKEANDRHGHAAGDQVLVGLSKLLKRYSRPDDLRARWGGDELVVALPGATAEGAVAVLLRLLEAVRGTDFVGPTREPFQITFSAGVGVFPEDGDSVDSLLGTADRRLYSAKRAGRGRVVAAG